MKKKIKIVRRRDYDVYGNWSHTYSKYILNKDGLLTPELRLALSSEGMSFKEEIDNSIKANKMILKEIDRMVKKLRQKDRRKKSLGTVFIPKKLDRRIKKAINKKVECYARKKML